LRAGGRPIAADQRPDGGVEAARRLLRLRAATGGTLRGEAWRWGS